MLARCPALQACLGAPACCLRCSGAAGGGVGGRGGGASCGTGCVGGGASAALARSVPCSVEWHAWLGALAPWNVLEWRVSCARWRRAAPTAAGEGRRTPQSPCDKARCRGGMSAALPAWGGVWTLVLLSGALDTHQLIPTHAHRRPSAAEVPGVTSLGCAGRSLAACCTPCAWCRRSAEGAWGQRVSAALPRHCALPDTHSSAAEGTPCFCRANPADSRPLCTPCAAARCGVLRRACGTSPRCAPRTARISDAAPRRHGGRCGCLLPPTFGCTA